MNVPRAIFTMMRFSPGIVVGSAVLAKLVGGDGAAVEITTLAAVTIKNDFRSFTFLVEGVHAISNPFIVPVDEANLSSSMPILWSMETKRFGNG